MTPQNPSLYRRFKIWLFGGTGTFRGCYDEASRDAMTRALAYKGRK